MVICYNSQNNNVLMSEKQVSEVLKQIAKTFKRFGKNSNG